MKFSYPESQVLVTLEEAGDSVLIRVTDEGRGMTREQLDSLFQPFQAGRSPGTAGEKSTGLGLVIVRRIVEGHGGTIEVRSKPGAGTTFSVSLPLEATDERAGE